MASALRWIADVVAIGAPAVAVLLLATIVVLADPHPTENAEPGPGGFKRFRAWCWMRLRIFFTNLQHVVLLRVPLLLGLLLIALPWVALHTSLTNKVRNLLVVTPVELFFVTLLAVIVAWVIVRTAGLTLLHGPERFGVEAWPALPTTDFGRRLARVISVLGRTAVAATAAPLVVVTAIQSLSDSPFGIPRGPGIGDGTVGRVVAMAIAVALGALAAIGLWWLNDFLRLDPSPDVRTKERWSDAEAGSLRRYLTAWIQRFSEWLYRNWFRWLGAGYAEDDHVATDHLAAVVQVILCLLLYVVIGVGFHPTSFFGASGFGWAPNGCLGAVPWLCMPTLGYLCVVIGVAAWILSGAAFLLDRWRAPTLLVLFVIFGSIAYKFPADHYYRMTRSTLPGVAASPSPSSSDTAAAGAVPAPEFPGPAEIVKRTLDAQVGPEPKRLVVVAVSGGGITSAAWSARVLTGLEEALGAPFRNTLSAVSTVSGGSVGAMYYLGAMTDRSERSEDVLQAIRDAAAAPSMRSIAWGIAYPDLLRAFLPFVLLGPRARYLDRALGAETAWEDAWSATIGAQRAPGTTGGRIGYGRQGESQNTWTAEPNAPYLLDLRERLATTDLPVPLFNAMTVEDGQQFIISPVDLVPAGGTPRRCDLLPAKASVAAIVESADAVTGTQRTTFDPPEPATSRQYCTYRETYPEQDLPLVTAARLSATFPWVSPVARPAEIDCPGADCGPKYHLSDGGYFDNSGLVGVMAWLDQVLPTFAEQASPMDDASAPAEILIVQIQWGAWQRVGSDALDPPKGGLFQLVGPLTALTRARGATQTSHNAQTLRLMNERWSRETLPRYRVNLKVVDFDLYSRLPAGSGEDPLPLAWQLTDREVDEINAAWCSKAMVDGVTEVAQYLRTSPKPLCPAQP